MRITVEEFGDNSLDKAQRLLAGINGGVEKATKDAMSRAVSRLRVNAAQEIKKEYAITTKDLRTEQNVRVKWAVNSGAVQADVIFSGHKLPLYRYTGVYPRVPTPDKTKKLPVLVGGGWKIVSPSIPTRARMKTASTASESSSAFVAQMKSGHIGIFNRVDPDNNRKIEERMGLSIAQMLGNENVQRELVNDASKKFGERLDDNVIRILNGWR